MLFIYLYIKITQIFVKLAKISGIYEKTPGYGNSLGNPSRSMLEALFLSRNALTCLGRSPMVRKKFFYEPFKSLHTTDCKTIAERVWKRHVVLSICHFSLEALSSSIKKGLLFFSFFFKKLTSAKKRNKCIKSCRSQLQGL